MEVFTVIEERNYDYTHHVKVYKSYWNALRDFVNLVNKQINSGDYINEDNVINANNKNCINYRDDLEYVLMYTDWENYTIYLKKNNILDINEEE